MVSASRRISINTYPEARFSFTKFQLGLLLVGIGVLLTLSFAAGFVVAERKTGELALGGWNGEEMAARVRGSREEEQNPPRNATVRLMPAAGDEGEKRAEEPARQAEFYRTLLKDKDGAEGASTLSPIRLPGATKGRRTEAEAPRRAGGRVTSARALPPVPPKVASKARGEARAERGFTIQIISVRRAGRAERIARAIRQRGYAATVEPVALEGKGAWFRVRVGRYPDRATALKALKALQANTALRSGEVVPL